MVGGDFAFAALIVMDILFNHAFLFAYNSSM